MTIHIKKKSFKQGDMVLVYDNKFMKHPGKFRTHWLGPYEVAYVTEGGAAKLKTLKGRMEGRFGKWELVEIVLRQPTASQLSVKA
jgi:hypothetical protein